MFFLEHFEKKRTFHGAKWNFPTRLPPHPCQPPHETSRQPHRTTRPGRLRRAGHRRRHQRRRLRRGARRPGRARRPDRPGRLRRLHQPAVEQPRLGRHQVPRKQRLRPGLGPVQEPQPSDRQLSVQRPGNPLLLDDRAGLPPPSALRLAGHLAVLAVRPRPHAHPALAVARHGQPRGARHPHGRLLRRLRVLRRLPVRQRRALRLPVHPRGDGPRRRRGQLRRIARRPTRGRRLDHPRARRHERTRIRDPRQGADQRGGAVRGRAQPQNRRDDRAPARLLQGHPPDRAAGHPEPARAHVLRRRRPAVLRHPDGPADLRGNHRHPFRIAVQRGDRGRPPLRAGQHQQAPAAGQAADARRRHRRALRRAAAGGQRGQRQRRRARLAADVTQARRRRQPRDGAHQYLRRQADRLRQRRQRSRGLRGGDGRRAAAPGAQVVRRTRSRGAR